MMDPETAQKIRFIKRQHLGELLQNIPKSQLQKKYGGDAPDLEVFW